MTNKSLTIGEVEKLRSGLNTTIAEAIQKFESETGMRVGYINTIRKKDRENSPSIDPYSEDRGECVGVNSSMDMEFD